jgi:hypothetical protein
LDEANRYHIPVRARRAYLAGFGSSGSLLAAAAVLFLVGSAIVAFGGWPQIGTRPATSNVAAAPVPLSSHASRRLLHALAATAPRVHAPGVVARSGVAGRAVHRSVAGRTVTRGTRATPTTGSSSPAAGSTSPGAATASVPASGCSSCTHPGGSPTPVSTVTSKVAQTVATVGGAVGQQITVLTGTVAKPLSAVSPPVGTAAGSVGGTVGSTVSGTATTAANAVSTVGNVLGGGH